MIGTLLVIVGALMIAIIGCEVIDRIVGGFRFPTSKPRG